MTSVTSTAQRGTTQLHSTPLAYGVGSLSEYCHNVRHGKTRMVVYRAGDERIKCDYMFSRFDTIRLCNGRTKTTLCSEKKTTHLCFLA